MKARLMNARVAVVIVVLWAWVASLARGEAAKVVILGGGVGVCAILFVVINRGIKNASADDGQSLFRLPVFRAMLIAEGMAIGGWFWYTGVHPVDLSVRWGVIALIVAAHFVGMARFTPFRYFYAMAIGMAVAGMLAVAMHAAHQDALGLLAVGVLCYATLFASAFRTLRMR